MAFRTGDAVDIIDPRYGSGSWIVVGVSGWCEGLGAVALAKRAGDQPEKWAPANALARTNRGSQPVQVT